MLVAHDADAYDRYYNVVANPLLWFIQHSLVGPRRLDRSSAARSTRRGGTATSRSIERSPTRSLPNWTTTRARRSSSTTTTCTSRRGSSGTARPDALLAHFVHIPWPVDWSVLPEPMRRAVHDGLLANDVVAFHTERAARNFVRSCEDVVGGTRATRVTHHPISIDVGEFERLSESDAVRAAETTLPRPEKLIVRVDRTDPSKNIVRGFHAFALLLEEHPEWRGRVTMLALLDPSRQAIPEYAEYVAADRASRPRAQRPVRARWSICRSQTTSRVRLRRTSSTTSSSSTPCPTG